MFVPHSFREQLARFSFGALSARSGAAEISRTVRLPSENKTSIAQQRNTNQQYKNAAHENGLKK